MFILKQSTPSIYCFSNNSCKEGNLQYSFFLSALLMNTSGLMKNVWQSFSYTRAAQNDIKTWKVRMFLCETTIRVTLVNRSCRPMLEKSAIYLLVAPEIIIVFLLVSSSRRSWWWRNFFYFFIFITSVSCTLWIRNWMHSIITDS